MSEQWFDKKFFQMFEELKDEMQELKIEMAKTTTMIRDYNGLREKLENVDDRVTKLESIDTTKEKSWTKIWAVAGTFATIGMFILALLK